MSRPSTPGLTPGLVGSSTCRMGTERKVVGKASGPHQKTTGVVALLRSSSYTDRAWCTSVPGKVDELTPHARDGALILIVIIVVIVFIVILIRYVDEQRRSGVFLHVEVLSATYEEPYTLNRARNAPPRKPRGVQPAADL